VGFSKAGDEGDEGDEGSRMEEEDIVGVGVTGIVGGGVGLGDGKITVDRGTIFSTQVKACR
jgi:hypothetical protein